MTFKKPTKKTLVVIDGNAIIHRAYHAISGLKTKDGKIVNAVFGFSSMLLKVYEQFKPDYLAVSFDVSGGTFRDKIYSEYKATRQKADQDLYDQIPLVHNIVEAFNIPIYEKKGFEADDVIGTIAEEMKKEKNIQTIIATGDADMLQLVDDKNTEVYLLRRGFSDMKLYNEDAVKEKYGFGPEKIVDYKALRGDTSDNIPGVHGIGDKGAKDLIEKIGSIEDIYKKSNRQQLEKDFSVSIIKKLEKGEEDAKMSFVLATIKKDVEGLKFDLEKCDAYNFDIKTVTDILKKFEFYSLLKRIPGNDVSKIEETISQKNYQKKSIKLVEINSSSAVKEFLSHAKAVKEFACKEVLSGDDVFTSTFLGLAFIIERKSYYIDITRLLPEDNKKIFSLFETKQNLVIGHDLKKLLKALMNIQVKPECQLFDIMIGSYLLNSSTKAHELKEIILRETGDELKDSNQGTLFGASPNALIHELFAIVTVYQKFERELYKEGIRKLFDNTEMALIPVLAQMELNGISIDKEMLGEMSKFAHKEIAKTVKKIYKLAGEEFNVSSSQQLRDVLFDKLNIPTHGIKKGKTGYSTAASELEKLRDYHEIIPLIEEYREMEKLRNTYIDVLPSLLNKKTGRIHTTFNQAVTTTGRLSSSDPNLQNIPIRTELGRKIRDAFVADSGCTLLAADYSQIELRIVASLAGDKKLIEIFEKGQDVHQATAAIIQGVPLKEVTKEMRFKAKAINFGVLYGMGAHGLSWRTGLTHYESKEFIERYFKGFAGVKKFLDETIKQAQKQGFVETLFGRKRYIPELSSDNFQIRNSGERMAINMPVQGTAADLMKLAMIDVYKELSIKYKSDEVKLLLQVHDELVLEVKNNLADEVGELVKKIMETVTKLDVPIDVHVYMDKRWGKMK